MKLIENNLKIIIIITMKNKRIILTIHINNCSPSTLKNYYYNDNKYKIIIKIIIKNKYKLIYLE